MAREVSVIAIDGPVAAGKTMVGRELARRLGFKYLDTGVMYRCITWLALRNATPMDDVDALGKLARANPIRLDGQDSDRVLVGGLSVGPELRNPEVDNNVSLVSKVTAVRRALVQQQQSLALEGKIVVVGRDIGTVVLPKADLKVYITASPKERARRRWRELLAKGQEVNFQQVLNETKARDDLDTTRADSPLRPAEDAWQLDTDNLSAEQVVQSILEWIGRLSEVGRAWA